MTYDASDRKSIRRAEKAAKIADRDRGIILVQICESTQGRRFLWDKLASAHVFSTTFDDNPQRSAFLEGERNQGLQLLTDIMQWCPDQFVQMMREANERRDTSPRRPDHDSSAGERSSSEDSGWDDQGSSDAAGEDAGSEAA